MNPCIPCIALSIMCLAGCSKKQTEPDAGASPPGTIALSHAPGFADIANHIHTAATDAGFKVISVRDGSTLSTQQVDAIVLCPGDRRVVAGTVPVISVDFDHRAGGRLAADAMHTALAGRGRVAILDHPREPWAGLRIRGFEEQLSKLNTAEDVDIRVVAQLPGGGARTRSRQSTQVILQAQGSLSGILAINEASALGAVEALEKAGMAKQVAIVGFGDAPLGPAFATIAPRREEIGTTTLTAIQQLLRGESTVREILIPMTLVRGGTAP